MCSPELVRQIMRHEGLVACQPRPFRVTTEADAEAAAGMPDLVRRDFTAEPPGREVRRLVHRRSYAHRTGRHGVEERRGDDRDRA